MSNGQGAGSEYRIRLTERERATLVAALEFWNAEVLYTKVRTDWFKIASKGHKFKRLTAGEVRRLAEELRALEPKL